jgi:hypothetical protein
MATFSAKASDMLYNGSTCPREFRNAYKLNSLMLGWNANAQLTNLPTFLTGKAQRVWTAIAANTAIDKSDIDKALKELVKALEPPTSSLLLNYEAARRHNNESISQFGSRLQELLIKAMPNQDPEERTTFLKMNLANQLPEHLKAMILFNPEKSYDQLLVILDQAMPQFSAHASGKSVGSFSHPPLIKQEPEIDSNYGSANQQPRYNSNNNHHQNNKNNRGSTTTPPQPLPPQHIMRLATALQNE